MSLMALIVILPLLAVAIVATLLPSFFSNVRSMLPVLVLLALTVLVLMLALMPDLAVRLVVLAVMIPCSR